MFNVDAAYGGNVGMAFQLADDIIDVTSSSDTSGKVQGTDLKERVPTLPTLLLREAAAEGDAAALHALELVDGPLDTDEQLTAAVQDRKSTRLNSSHVAISYAVFCLKK